MNENARVTTFIFRIAVRPIAGLLGLLCVFVVSALADDWPMFGRDRTRNAYSFEKNPPIWWQIEEAEEGKIERPKENIKWSTMIGTGRSYYHSYADPVVVDGMVWIGTNTTETIEGKEQPFYALRCFDEKTGKLRSTYLCPWYPALGAERFRHTLQTSPLIEGDRMWFYTNRMEVVCLDIAAVRKGKSELREIWKRDLRKDLGVYRTKSIWECRLCSVATHGDYLYVTTGNGINYWDGLDKVNAKAPSLVCFDKNTGKIIWQDNSPGENIIHSQFASPTIITIGKETQVVAPQGDGWVRSFDAATGKLIWEFNTNPPEALADGGRGKRNYLPATAVFYDNRIYIGNGQEPEQRSGEAWLYCIDPAKQGNISAHLPNGKPNPKSGTIWKYGGKDPKSNAIIFNRTLSNVTCAKGILIAVDINGTVHCLDARTGKVHWTHQTRYEIQGSPLIVDDKVYVGNDGRQIMIFELSTAKRLIDTIKMEWWVRSSPVFANGVLYVAAGNTLYAIAGNERKPGK